MTEVEQKFEQLAQKLVPHSKLRRIWSLSGGLSAEMVAFELEDAAGQQRTLIKRSYGKVQLTADPPPVEREFRLLHITQSLGLATPAPFYLDLSGEIFPEPYLVIEYIKGQMLFAPADLDHHLYQLANHLAQIHGADYTNFDLSFLPRRMNSCAEMERKRPKYPNASLGEARIRKILTSLQPLPQYNSSTLLHGDYWPGNSLWQEGKLVAVIDWEDAEWGEPLCDLAKSRSEIAWIFGIGAMDSFTRFYQFLMSLDETHLPYWDLCAALRFIRLFGQNLAEAGAFFIPFGRDDVNEQTIRANFGVFVGQAFGALGS
jgi:aminoglycoside phosphotransferase (APT) family kinase protein